MTAASFEFATAGRIMAGAGRAAELPGASVADGVAWIRQTLALLAVPGLAAFGLTAGQASDIAAQALTSSSMQGNPVRLSQDELESAVREAL
jgi:alcohol dehydrogenase class IV